MSRLEAASVVAILVGLFAVGSLWFGEREPDPPRPSAPTSPAPTPPAEPETRPTPARTEAGMPTRRLSDPGAPLDYPIDEEYRGRSFSAVPHELVAAHAEGASQAGEGARRLFVAVVEPGLSDDRVEQLVRDLRARHAEAEVLRVRVFDSKPAALTPAWSDAGAARDAHLLADLLREPGRERFVLRGREIVP